MNGYAYAIFARSTRHKKKKSTRKRIDRTLVNVVLLKRRDCQFGKRLLRSVSHNIQMHLINHKKTILTIFSDCLFQALHCVLHSMDFLKCYLNLYYLNNSYFPFLNI